MSNENKQHIAYKEHSYAIPKETIDKVDSNSLKEKYFCINEKLKKKMVPYFKYLFVINYLLKPIDAQIHFKKQFPI